MGVEHKRHFSAEEKTKVVLRLLRGEDLDTLAEELKAPPERLARWERRFLSAGQKAFDKPKQPWMSPAVWQWAALLIVLVITVAVLSHLINPNQAP